MLCKTVDVHRGIYGGGGDMEKSNKFKIGLAKGEDIDVENVRKINEHVR